MMVVVKRNTHEVVGRLLSHVIIQNSAKLWQTDYQLFGGPDTPASRQITTGQCKPSGLHPVAGALGSTFGWTRSRFPMLALPLQLLVFSVWINMLPHS